MIARQLAAVVLATIAGTTFAGTPRLVQLLAPESAPPPLIVPNMPLPVVVHAMSVDEFACNFKPAAGTYRVTLIHPKTCCPVEVCFTLPCGCTRKVTTSKYSMRIVYPGLFNDVVIRFKLDGTVSVRDA